MAAFDPTRFNFVQLENFRFPGDVAVYEYKNHAVVDGKKDFLRINLYLTVDVDYVTIWNGLLEPTITEGECESGRLASAASRKISISAATTKIYSKAILIPTRQPHTSSRPSESANLPDTSCHRC